MYALVLARSCGAPGHVTTNCIRYARARLRRRRTKPAAQAARRQREATHDAAAAAAARARFPNLVCTAGQGRRWRKASDVDAHLSQKEENSHTRHRRRSGRALSCCMPKDAKLAVYEADNS